MKEFSKSKPLQEIHTWEEKTLTIEWSTTSWQNSSANTNMIFLEINELCDDFELHVNEPNEPCQLKHKLLLKLIPYMKELTSTQPLLVLNSKNFALISSDPLWILLKKFCE